MAGEFENDHELLKIGPHVVALPIIHGSGDFAWEVRRFMMHGSFDCVAVPLPPSFQEDVERAVLKLPTPSLVLQKSVSEYQSNWQPENSEEESDEIDAAASYVPIDPCQGVIAAIRTAIGEHLPIKFIDLETAQFEPYSAVLPDAYALKKVPVQQFAAAVLPHLQSPDHQQGRDRIVHMAWQLKELSIDYRRILLVCSVLDWPWIRQAFMQTAVERPAPDVVRDPECFQIKPETLFFMLGELPFITGLYETARAELGDDTNLSIDGVKELLIHARATYQADFKNRARRITPKLLSQCLKYIRNLTLIEHQFTPQLMTLILAAKQMVGDGYALHVLEQSREYPYEEDLGWEEIRMGIDRAALPDDQVVSMVNRLPGPPIQWSAIELQPKPDYETRQEWKQKWNPYSQCSYPPEDVLIENFRASVFDRAVELMGADLARTEKFTTSVKDGIDIRDTLRNWHEKQIYVKVLPPNRGRLDAAVMLFDSPADPREYPWRSTWFAEHDQESTLAFYATDFRDEPVGPGICLATYGGSMFIFPPIGIPDIWQDPRLDFTTTMEERLLAAACLHSSCPHVALVSPLPPGPGWRRLAKKYKKQFVHLPLNRFSDSTVQQLRILHVLNGKQVRSYAAEFIRRV